MTLSIPSCSRIGTKLPSSNNSSSEKSGIQHALPIEPLVFKNYQKLIDYQEDEGTDFEDEDNLLDLEIRQALTGSEALFKQHEEVKTSSSMDQLHRLLKITENNTNLGSRNSRNQVQLQPNLVCSSQTQVQQYSIGCTSSQQTMRQSFHENQISQPQLKSIAQLLQSGLMTRSSLLSSDQSKVPSLRVSTNEDGLKYFEGMLHINNKSEVSNEFYDGKTLTSQETEVECEQNGPRDLNVLKQVMNIVTCKQPVSSFASESRPQYFNASTFGSNQSSQPMATRRVGAPEGFQLPSDSFLAPKLDTTSMKGRQGARLVKQGPSPLIMMSKLTKESTKKYARIKQQKQEQQNCSIPSLPSEYCEASLSSDSEDLVGPYLSDSHNLGRLDNKNVKFASLADDEAQDDHSCDSAGVESILMTGVSEKQAITAPLNVPKLEIGNTPLKTVLLELPETLLTSGRIVVRASRHLPGSLDVDDCRSESLCRLRSEIKSQQFCQVHIEGAQLPPRPVSQLAIQKSACNTPVGSCSSNTGELQHLSQKTFSLFRFPSSSRPPIQNLFCRLSSNKQVVDLRFC